MIRKDAHRWTLAVLSFGMVLGSATMAPAQDAPITANDVDKPHVARAPAPTPNADVVRGRYIAIVGDCVACHTNPSGGKPFAGGYALQTPFGKLVASNITSDRETGVGRWTESEFARALREGIGKQGEHLYPAMPYTSYAKMSDQDVHDLWLYMKTVPAAHNAVVSNQLPFPFNIRLSLIGWNLMFFNEAHFHPRGDKSEEWNRGAYLVEALEHCSACHTPKNLLGGDKADKAFNGTSLQGWNAPDITTNKAVGIGGWSTEQIIQYLKIGSNGISVASGPMAEAVTNSTQHLTDPDLHAIAVYLQSLPDSAATKPAPVAAGDPIMVHGKRVFEVACAACHASSGAGINAMATTLAGNPGIQSADADSLVHTVLQGGRGAITSGNPTGAAMPSFAWNLSDAQIAAAITYVRNSWNNAAPIVTEAAVAKTRKALNLNLVGQRPAPTQ